MGSNKYTAQTTDGTAPDVGMTTLPTTPKKGFGMSNTSQVRNPQRAMGGMTKPPRATSAITRGGLTRKAPTTDLYAQNGITGISSILEPGTYNLNSLLGIPSTPQPIKSTAISPTTQSSLMGTLTNLANRR